VVFYADMCVASALSMFVLEVTNEQASVIDFVLFDQVIMAFWKYMSALRCIFSID
jgi:hypothetical protein